jgi:hypothetical protein
MHPDPSAGSELAPRRAAAPPPAGNVHGLGLVDALRIDVEPAQLPWLSVEIGTLRYCLEDEFAHQRVRYDELPEPSKEHRRPSARDAERELARRARQLQALALIREQIPISGEAATAAVASPWCEPAEGAAPTLQRAGEPPVTVVGPAALMTLLVRRATRNVADALAEALRSSALDVDEHTDSCSGWRGAELPRVKLAIAEKLRAIAAAAQAFTDTYLNVLALQTYGFDPELQRVCAEEF